MDPKNVTSLELSKELKEFGWKKKTEFWWVKCSDKSWELTDNDFQMNYKIKFPAPLATEILEELPIDIAGHDLEMVIYKAAGGRGYSVSYPHKYGGSFGYCDLSLTTALAKIWLCLRISSRSQKKSKPKKETHGR